MKNITNVTGGSSSHRLPRRTVLESASTLKEKTGEAERRGVVLSTAASTLPSTSAGGSLVDMKRKRSEEPDRRKKTGGYQRRISAIELLHLRGVIDDACYAAGCALMRDWEKAHIDVYVSTFARERVDCAHSARRIDGDFLNARQLEGIDDVNRVLKTQNSRGRFLLIAVCVESKGFQDIQHETGWQIRYISERFKEAIEDLAVAYGFKKRAPDREMC